MLAAALPFLDVEKQRRLCKRKNFELWEATLSGRKILLRSFSSFRLSAWNDFVRQSTIRHPLVLTPEIAGFLTDGAFCYVTTLEFQPMATPGDVNVHAIVLQGLSLGLSLQSRDMVFRWDPSRLVYDSNGNRAYLSGVVFVKDSNSEKEENPLHLLDSLREYSSGDPVQNVLKKWIRRKVPDLAGCFHELATDGFDPSSTVTFFECPRKKELEIAIGLAALAQKSQGKAAVFRGEPGEGKTILLRQIWRELIHRGIPVVLFSADATDRPYSSLRKLMECLMDYPLLQKRIRPMSPQIGEEQMVELLLQLFQQFKKESCAFVVLIDDFQHLDPFSRRILFQLFARFQELPVTFLFTSPHPEPGNNLLSLSLEEIPFSVLEESVFVPLWNGEQRRNMMEQIYRRCSGNILFFRECLLETFRKKADSVVWDRQEWYFRDQQLPVLPEALSRFYLDSLPPLSDEEKETLCRASVQGSSFEAELCRAKPAVLKSLEEKGLVIRVEDRYRFRSSLLADSLYEGINKETAARYHEELAEDFLVRCGEDLTPTAVWHFLKAGQVARAVEYCCAILEKRKKCSTNNIILQLLEDLSSRIESVSEDLQRRFHAARAAVFMTRGDYHSAVRSLRKLAGEPEYGVKLAWCLLGNNEIRASVEMLKSLDSKSLSPGDRLEYYLCSAVAQWHRGEQGKEDLQKAMDLAEEMGTSAGWSRFYREKAELLLRQGAFSEAESYARKGLRYAKRAYHAEDAGNCLRILAAIAWRKSRHLIAEKMLKRSLRYFQKIDHLYGMATSSNLLGNIYFERYQYHRALKAYEKAASMFGQICNPLRLGVAEFNRGQIYIEQGNLAKAGEIYEQCARIDKKAGSKRYYAYDLRALAVVCHFRGYYKKAARLLKRVLEICQELKAEEDIFQTKMIELLNELQQGNSRQTASLADFLKKQLGVFDEPRADAEIHYLLGIRELQEGNSAAARKHFEDSVRLAQKIGYHRLLGMNLLMGFIARNRPPSSGDSEFRRAIRYFQKAKNRTHLFHHLLKLYLAFPPLLKDKGHRKWVERIEQFYRKIGPNPFLRSVLQLRRSKKSLSQQMESDYEPWFELLQSGSISIEVLLQRLQTEFQADLIWIRLRDGLSEPRSFCQPPEMDIMLAEQFRSVLMERFAVHGEPLVAGIDQFQDLRSHPWVQLHRVSSVMLVPVKKSQEDVGFWYFERWGSVPGFLRRDASKALFLATALVPWTTFSYPEKSSSSSSPVRFADFVGNSKPMQELYRLMEKAAPLDISVLICGESGTGKELVAKNIHRNSTRSSGPFCALNCSALPENLIESELFGFARGAFTGAVMGKPGLVEKAHGGTLFLDEIGDLSSAAQAKLLRVLQEREIQRLGETTTRKVDVRFLFATHKDLKKMVREGLYREDLYYRISVLTITVPALRDRKEDIVLLAHHFLEKYSRSFGKSGIVFDPAVLRMFVSYPWPGNVREMENVVQSLLVHVESNSRIGVDSLPAHFTGDRSVQRLAGLTLEQARESFERQFISQALERNKGNRTQTAKELGITRQGLINLMNRLSIRER